MNISLPQQIEEYINVQIATGAYPSAGALVEEALKAHQMLDVASVHLDPAMSQRRAEAIRLHEIEGNPFTEEDEQMFAMFDRKGWGFEQRAEYIKQQALNCSSATDDR